MKKKQRNRRMEDGTIIPNADELRQFNAACNRFLISRGEHVWTFRENISRECKLNNAEK